MLFFTYSFRSLIKRLRTNVVTALAIVLFVVGASAGLGFYLSLKHQVVDTAPKENVLVLARGTPSEGGSRLDLEAARKAALFEGVKQNGTTPLATKETLATLQVQPKKPSAMIRGIDEMSMTVHGATMIEGSPPAPGSLDVMFGRRAIQRYSGLKVGSEIHLTGGVARITGVFAALGGPMEDELWMQRSALETTLKQKFLSSTTLVATSVSEVPSLVQKLNDSKAIEVQAASLAEFRASKAGLETILKVVLALLVLLSVVATSAIAVTMSAAVVARLPEFASMIAIGVRKSVASRIVIVESLLLAMFSTFVGLALAAALRSALGTVTIGGTSVEMTSSLTVTLFGLALGLAVGLIGSLVPALSVRRLDLALRLRT